MTPVNSAHTGGWAADVFLTGVVAGVLLTLLTIAVIAGVS